MSGALGQGVGEELDSRREADAETLADVAADATAVVGERLGGRGALGVRAEDGVEHRGVLQVARDAHVGDREEAHPLVLETELDELGDERLDAVSDLAGASLVGHGILLEPGDVFAPTLCDVSGREHRGFCVCGSCRLRRFAEQLP